MAKQSTSRPMRALWAVLGCLSFGLGVLGAFLPVLPTTPFIMLSAFCFSRSSERLQAWFVSTKLYHQVFESYVDRRQMTIKNKLQILVPLTCLFGIGFYFMWHIVPMRFVLGVIWLAHVYYFGFKVKTASAQ